MTVAASAMAAKKTIGHLSKRVATRRFQGRRVLGRYVSSWACVTGRQQRQFVLLGYACAVDPGYAGDCGGSKEWVRLLDAKGRLADVGVPRDGAARDRLYARLGIADAMAAGVSMTPLVR